MAAPGVMTRTRRLLLLGGEHVLGGYDVRDGKVAFTASTYTTMRELYAGKDGHRDDSRES